MNARITLVPGFRVAVALLTVMLLGGILQGQTLTPTDPGPRPVGNNNPFCPPTPGAIQSAKFPTAPACIDTVQPPDSIGDAGAGNVVSGSSNLTGFWFQALAVFEVKANVGPGPQTGAGTFPGLGPSFNAVSCFQCHSQPTVGGSSPNKNTPGFPGGNPQVGDAPTAAQLQAVSSFITATGPVREARFPNGSPGDDTIFRDPVPAGSVANLFVIKGRPDAPANCQIAQEDFPTQVANHNIIFRIPIPTFGEGFVENTADDNLEGNLTTEDAIANNPNFFNPVLGIAGSFNISGNDQTISRFGWKAQNKSMLVFAGEASNVEMGVSNENFPNERTDGNGQCSPNPEPEDQVIVPPDPTDPNLRTILTIFNNPNFGASGVASDISSDIENFAVFMRLNASPSQCNYNSGLDANGKALCKALDASAQRGAKVFGSLDPSVAGSLTSPSPDNNPNTSAIKPIGCVLCHSNFLRTTTSATPELNNAVFHPFSDFALHTMDSSLSDGVTQGNAGPAQFRSAPLWGLGQRLFFLHDGRASNLLDAIKDHAPNIGTSPANCTPAQGEACQVIVLFNNLSPSLKQDLLNFLRSL
ncbi:MAG TPA: di-heme oxidoredictase family protein [Candidatus Angelobacter sp.]|nr:di-heme oxidoredictase family protein [Candidatus Angelobacter sp.]